MKITVEYEDASYQGTATNKQYYRILQDDEMDFYSRPVDQGDPLKGKPMVFRFYPHKYEPMTSQVQWFWYNLNRTGNIVNDKNAFPEYADAAWCNSQKVRDSKDYVNNERMDRPLPTMSRLICGLNVVCGVEMLAPANIGIPAGRPVLRLETLDPHNLPSGNLLGDEWRHVIHIANIIRPEIMPNGLQQVNAFPQLGGRDGTPVRYMLMADEPVYYELRMLKKLKLGDRLPPYYNPA